MFATHTHTHPVAYRHPKNDTNSKNLKKMEEYYRQHTQNLSARRFYRSFLTYLSVCGLLTALNIYTSPGHLWVAWIWGIWGIGILCKGIFTLVPEPETRYGNAADDYQWHAPYHTSRTYRRRTFLCHIVTYVLSISALAWILPGNIWIFPALGWGIGIAVHAVNTFFETEPDSRH